MTEREVEQVGGRVTILGARGSIPVSGAEYLRYGGATTCVVAELAGTVVVVDAGSGFTRLAEVLPQAYTDGTRVLPLLLTHPHLDHLIGLPLCPLCLLPGVRVDCYVRERAGLDARTIVNRLFTPPYWPVTPEQLPARFRFLPLPEALDLDGVRVETLEGAHPGGVTLLRLTGGGRRVVLATDCTLTDALTDRLEDFARGCDLLLVDGQYREEQWPERRSFGHSTWTMAARFGAACGAKRVRVTHHDPAHTDAVLDAGEAEAERLCPVCRFAREGEVIAL